MLAQQTLEQATWAAGASSYIKLNRIPRIVDGALAHLVCLVLKLQVTVTAAAGNDTAAAELIRAIDELQIEDSIGTVLLRLKGHMLRTMLWLMTGRLSGGFADPLKVTAGTGAGNVRTCRVAIPFYGAGGQLANGIMGLQKWSDALQPMDRFLGDNAKITVKWGSATPFTYGTLTAATLTVTPFCIGLTELDQGVDLRLNYQSWGAAQRFDLSLKAPKLLCAAFVNPSMDHSDYTELDVKNGLLVKADPIERVAMFNGQCPPTAVDQLTVATPELLPIVWAFPGQGITKLHGFGYPPILNIETVTTHATDQWIAFAELFNRSQLVGNLQAAGLGDFSRVTAQTPKYSGKNYRADTPKAVVFNALAPAKLRRTA